MFESKTLESKIEESNVGHQMLKKMGVSFLLFECYQGPYVHITVVDYYSIH